MFTQDDKIIKSWRKTWISNGKMKYIGPYSNKKLERNLLYNHAYVNLHKHVFIILYWFILQKHVLKHYKISKWRFTIFGSICVLVLSRHDNFCRMPLSYNCCMSGNFRILNNLAYFRGITKFYQKLTSKFWIMKIYQNIELFLGSNFAKISQH